MQEQSHDQQDVKESSKSEERKIATQELEELGIEPINENIEAVLAQKNTKQHPTSFKEVTGSLESEDLLFIKMKEAGIASIIHSEGQTVWDHVRLAIETVNKLKIDESLRGELRIIMLYHDLGKTIVANLAINIEATQKHLDDRKSLHSSMIGHESADLEEIEKGLRANNIEDSKVKKYMIVIRNHMNTSLASQDPIKTAELIDSFAETEQERKEILEMLVLVFHADGTATEHIDIVDDKIVKSKNNKKIEIKFEDIWENYKEGKKRQKQMEAKEERKALDIQFEIQVLGSDVQTYLRQKDVQEGKQLTQAVRILKEFLRENNNIQINHLREIIESLDLEGLSQPITVEGKNKPNPYEPKLKIFGEMAQRIERNQYALLVQIVIEKARPYFEQLTDTAQLTDKPSFGDIDLIAQRTEFPTEDLYREIFGTNFVRAVVSENQDSVLVRIPPYGTYHVDFIHAKNPTDFETKLTYYSKGHLSRTIGLVADTAGFKYGVEGFCKRYKTQSGADADFLITPNLRDSLRILGYDQSHFDNIQTVDEIVEFVQTSPFFNPNAFELQNLKKSRRQAYRQRAQERYLLDKLSQIVKQPNEQDFDKYFKELYPQEYERYLAVLEKEKVPQERRRQPINGFVVTESFKLDSKRDWVKVRGILEYIKDRYPEATSIDEEMKEEIRREFELN